MYLQHDGIAMGSPLGQFLSNTFMGFIERWEISKYKMIFFKYVDDCFILGKNEKEIDEILVCLSKHINDI